MFLSSFLPAHCDFISVKAVGGAHILLIVEEIEIPNITRKG